MGYASTVQVKTCNKCGESKPFECFSTTKPGRGDRYNLRSKCKDCRAKENLEWHRNNAARSKANHGQWYARNKEHSSVYAKKWRSENAERFTEYNKLWAQQNAPQRAMRASARKALKLKATPIWLSAIELAQIQEMYEIAAAKTMQTGIDHHVDHIHPLMGEGYSGLHVPWNLRVIPAKENIAKKNRIPAEDKHLFWSI